MNHSPNAPFRNLSPGLSNRLTALVATALLGYSPAFADNISSPLDDEETRRHGIFIDSLDVSLVNVEVFVTRNGEPVPDLTRDDFRVFDDGQPVDLTHLYRVDGGYRADEPKLPQDVTSDTGPAIPAEPSSIIVLVDHSFISPMSRKLVFDNLSTSLDTLMRDGTRVMVVSKTRQVEIAQGSTTDRNDVQAALDRLAITATGTYASEVRRTVQSIEQSAVAIQGRQTGRGPSATTETAESDARLAYQEAQSHSQAMFADVRASLGLLRDFLASLAGLPGRKAVLYVADRLPARSGELVWQVWHAKYGRDWGSQFGASSVDAVLRDFDSTAEIRELIADANTNRVAFYPIGAGADAGPDLFGAESRGLARPTSNFTRLSESDDGLRWLARDTGGRVAIGRGDVSDFFDQLSQDLTHYYSLAYPSPHRGDGQTHTIEIHLRQPDGSFAPPAGDLEIRYLAEYRDKSADQQMADRTFAALVLGVADNPLEVRVKIGDGKRQSDGHYSVPLEIQVPVANLVMIPDATSHWAKVTIQLIVRDQAGRVSDPQRIRLPIEIPHAGLLQALSESAVYATELTLRGGAQTLAIGVHDDHSATASTINLPVDVGGRG